jgi:hypothetical protein
MNSSQLRLLSDLRAIKSEVGAAAGWKSTAKPTPSDLADLVVPLPCTLPSLAAQPPEGCSASPVSEDNLYLWTATIFGPEVRGHALLLNALRCCVPVCLAAPCPSLPCSPFSSTLCLLNCVVTCCMCAAWSTQETPWEVCGTLVVVNRQPPHGHAQQLLWAPSTQPASPNTLPTLPDTTVLLLLLLHHLPQGGIFSLKLQFTEHYPAKPPRVRFTCEMFHPNVSVSSRRGMQDRALAAAAGAGDCTC